MVDQISIPPKVKQSVIISNKLVYTSYLTNDLRFRILGNQEIKENLKVSQNYCLSRPVLSRPLEMKNLSLLVKFSRKTKIELFPYCALSNENPAGKYWSPGCLEDVPLQNSQDVPLKNLFDRPGKADATSQSDVLGTS